MSSPLLPSSSHGSDKGGRPKKPGVMAELRMSEEELGRVLESLTPKEREALDHFPYGSVLAVAGERHRRSLKTQDDHLTAVYSKTIAVRRDWEDVERARVLNAVFFNLYRGSTEG
jgi:hypothetical protein